MSPRAGVPIRVRIAASSRPFLRVRTWTEEDAAVEPVQAVKRIRRISMSGTGRGTGRGGKAAEATLTKPLKRTGKRAEFVRYIGDRAVSVVDLRTQFRMTEANVNGYLTNLHKDHGVGYSKESGELRLVLPDGATFQNIWRT